jgi:hypothetical protein
MNPLKKVAVILPFNDVETMSGGSRNGIKSKISYFNQFLMLYESIQENWHNEHFEHQLIVLHSMPFNKKKKAILDRLNVEIVTSEYQEHPLKIRPGAYIMDFDCDFRLILDVDMIALKEPVFDFKVSAQAVYGGNKYNKNQWQNICRYLGCKVPSFLSMKLKKGRYQRWGILEHYLYHAGWLRWKIFPFFNNGAVLIKNELAPKLGDVWLEFRRSYTKYVQATQGIDIDQEGQDVIGLAINDSLYSWSTLPRGFNYAVNDSFPLGRLMNKNTRNGVSMLHYINVGKGTYCYDLVERYYKKVINKYYG